MTLSFKEFLKISNAHDDEIREIFFSLSSTHSIFKKNAVIQDILQNPDRRITYADIVRIHQDVSAYIVKIAPKSSNPHADPILSLSEIAALQSTLSLLNAILVAKSQSAIQKIADLNTTTRIATNNT